MIEYPPAPVKLNESSFSQEEFLLRINNFYLYFIDKEFGDIYRNNKYYRDFETRHPELARKLRDDYKKSDSVRVFIQNHLSDLHDAYLKLRACGASNKVLDVKYWDSAP